MDMANIMGCDLDLHQTSQLSQQLKSIEEKDEAGRELLAQSCDLFGALVQQLQDDDRAMDKFAEEYKRYLDEPEIHKTFGEPVIEQVRIPAFKHLLGVLPETSHKATVVGGRRYNFSTDVANVLKLWLKDHLDKPYPTDSEKKMLAEKTNLTVDQINSWFINARRRIVPQLRKSGKGKGKRRKRKRQEYEEEENYKDEEYKDLNVTDVDYVEESEKEKSKIGMDKERVETQKVKSKNHKHRMDTHDPNTENNNSNNVYEDEEDEYVMNEEEFELEQDSDKEQDTKQDELKNTATDQIEEVKNTVNDQTAGEGMQRDDSDEERNTKVNGQTAPEVVQVEDKGEEGVKDQSEGKIKDTDEQKEDKSEGTGEVKDKDDQNNEKVQQKDKDYQS